VVGYGAPAEYVISVRNHVPGNPFSEPVEAKRLLPDWDPRWEAAVLANPKAAESGNEGFTVQLAAAAPADANELTVVSGVVPAPGARWRARSTGEEMIVTSARLASDPPNPDDDDDEEPELGSVEPSGALGTQYIVRVQRGVNGVAPEALHDMQVLDWLMPGVEWVFRRYRLPQALRSVTLLKDLPILDGRGQRIKAQVFQWRTYLDAPPSGSANELVGYLDTEPTLISGNVEIDLARGSVVLGKPAVNCIGKRIEVDPETGTEKIVTQYAPAVVGVTLAYQKGWLWRDTGVAMGSDVTLPFAGAGQTEVVQWDTLRLDRITNFGEPLSGLAWGAWVFDAATGDGVKYDAPVTLRDDGRALQRLVRDIQAEKSRRHKAYTVSLPWFSRGLRPGLRLIVDGVRDWVDEGYVISQVQWDLEANTTTAAADNVKPPARREIVA
jgi:hypothetical protein